MNLYTLLYTLFHTLTKVTFANRCVINGVRYVVKSKTAKRSQSFGIRVLSERGVGQPSYASYAMLEKFCSWKPFNRVDETRPEFFAGVSWVSETFGKDGNIVRGWSEEFKCMLGTVDHGWKFNKSKRILRAETIEPCNVLFIKTDGAKEQVRSNTYYMLEIERGSKYTELHDDS